MSFAVRCKYYVSSVETRRHEHLSADNPENVPYVTVHFQAVKSNNPTSENYQFFTASPSGTMKLSGKLSDLEQYKVGTYWYLDWERIDWELTGCDLLLAKPEVKDKYKAKQNEPNVWQLKAMSTDSYLSNLSVVLGMARNWTEVNGEYSVYISNDKVWSQYQKIGDLYTMTATPATKEG